MVTFGLILISLLGMTAATVEIDSRNAKAHDIEVSSLDKSTGRALEGSYCEYSVAQVRDKGVTYQRCWVSKEAQDAVVKWKEGK